MLVVLLLLLGAAGSQATAENTVLCGLELAKAHSMYCYGVELFPDDSELFASPPKAGPRTNSLKIPERFEFGARSTAEARLRSANLIKACCLKPCHVSELLNHC